MRSVGARKMPSDTLSDRASRIVFCLLMLMAWSGGVDLARLREARAASPAEASDPRKNMSDVMEQLAGQAEKIRRTLPRDSFDPAALAGKLGKDPAALFAWVRDQTYWVPYRGVLRSDSGVLMERIGNSIDRSILLYSLLKSAGHSARIAHAQLNANQAMQLLARLRRPGKSQLAATQGAPVLDKSLQARLEKLQFPVRRMEEELVQRVAEQTPVLLHAIESENPIRHAGTDKADVLAALCDHWWVQVQQGSNWQDLDPLLPDSQPGRSLCPPDKTFHPERLTDLDESMLHVVQVRLMIEILDKGKVSQKPVLTQKLLPAAMTGHRIAISHSPVAWPENLDFSKSADALGEFKKTVQDQVEWMPVLVADGQKIARYTFTVDGTINDPTLPTYVQAAIRGRAVVGGVESGSQQTGGAVGGMLGGGRVGGIGMPRRAQPQPKEKKSAPPQLTAEWIEYQILVPGQSPRIIRRQIFDLLGPSARAAQEFDSLSITETDRLRRGLALLGETEIMPLAGRFSPQYLLDMVAQNLAANRAALQDLLSTDDRHAQGFAERAAKIEPLSSELISLAVLRQLASVNRNDIYLDRPDLFSRHRFIRVTDQGDLVGCSGVDIVANDIAIVPWSSADPFRVRVQQGIVDTNAEALLDGGCARVENTGEMLFAATARGVDWLKIRRADDSAWVATKYPHDFRARINDDLAKGLIVLAPRQAVYLSGRWSAGWWRIDPTTGQTLGMGPRGWGQTATERLMITSAIGVAVLGFCFAAGIKERSYLKGTLCFLGMSCCAGALVLVLLTMPEFIFWLAEASSGTLLVSIPVGEDAVAMIEIAEKLKFVCELSSVGSIPGDYSSIMGKGEPKEGGGPPEGGAGAPGANPGEGGRSGSGGQGGSPPASRAGGSKGLPPLGVNNDGYKNGYPHQDEPYPPPPDWQNMRDFPDQ